jgi:alcohol dehydrogenase
MAYQTFQLATEIHYGWGALEALDAVKSKRTLLVSDPQVRALGFADKVEAALKKNGAEVVVFDRVEPDPSFDTCDAATAVAEDFKPDTIIGLGGGSAMDTAKGARLRYETPGVSWADLEAVWGIHPQRRENFVKHIAIPSTSGTGSEVTVDAVITDRKVQPAVKHDLFVGHPHISILDPEIPSTMPPSVTANTGMDVYAHALEGYTCVGAQTLIDAVAIHAMREVERWLPRAVADGKDRDARDHMHTAAMMGGIGNNAGATVVHGTAHQLGSAFGVPHGRGCAIMLPYGVAFLAPAMGSRLSDLAKYLGMESGSDKEAAELLVQRILDLNKAVGIPASLSATGIDAAKWANELDAVSANALADVTQPLNPREPSLQDIKQMFVAAWEGKMPKVEG